MIKFIPKPKVLEDGIERIKAQIPEHGSLKRGIIKAIILGIALAMLVFITVYPISEHIIVNHYATDKGREAREDRLMEEFKKYVSDNNISSGDKESLRGFVEQRTYIYLLIYKGDDFYFSSGLYDDATFSPLLSNRLFGGSVDYPTEEEMREYAENNDLVKVEMADGQVYASIIEFSEYLYFDIARIISVGLAMCALALVITVYFFRVMNRITRLASDVKVIADGNMGHKIVADGNDEISRLSYDVENMRGAIVQTLESERAARTANTELITAMSHDIRTPLTVLIGYLDIMKMYSKDEQMDEYIKRSEITAMRLKKLSDDMFNYLLVFGDTAEPCKLEEYDGATLIDQLLTEHIILLNEQGYDVRFTGNENVHKTVLTSVPELMRIIDNVFSNILKYADKTSPIYIKVTARDDVLTMNFSNRIAKDIDMAESNGIGLKTCVKIAELIACEFSSAKSEEGFSASVGLIAKGADNNDTVL